MKHTGESLRVLLEHEVSNRHAGKGPVERAKGLVIQLADVDYDTATALLDECEYDVKLAVLRARGASDLDAARVALNRADGFLRRALEELS